MPVCDICSKNINWSDGYVLSTSQVATSEAYWEFAFTHQWSYTHSMDPDGDTVAMLTQQQAGQSSGWLICESCSKLFSFDRQIAREHAKRRSSNPPGSGPASVQKVALAAANVWNKLYGKWPSSVKKPKASEEKKPAPKEKAPVAKLARKKAPAKASAKKPEEKKKTEASSMANYAYDEKVRFGDVTTVTAWLLEGIALSDNAKRAWNAAGGGVFGDTGQDLLKVHEITPNLSFQCAGCGKSFGVSSMNANFADGKISAEGTEWELSKLDKCPICGNEFIHVRVKASDRFAIKRWDKPKATHQKKWWQIWR